MAAVHFLGLLFVLGFAQGNSVIGRSPAIIEDLRNAQSARIVAGWEAQRGQFPHQISLRMVNIIGSVSSCGGSIIHHQWVITAAHCLANRINFVVRFGATNLTQPTFIVEASRRFIHPNYNEFGPVQTDDIALLGIDQHIPYGPYIQPCRLQNSETKNVDYTGVRLTVSGYGLTDDAVNGGATTEHLRWVHLRGITNEECRAWYGGSSVIQEQTICAEYYNNTAQSSCQGDSGGPLTVVDADGKPTMVGVVSFGSSAGCNSVFPSAYVRPGHYHPWMTQVTGINFDWRSKDLESSEEDQDSTEEDQDSTEEDQDSTEEDQDSTQEDQDSTEEDRDSTEEDRDSTEEDRDSTEEDRDSTEEDRDSTEEDRDSTEENQDSTEEDQSVVKRRVIREVNRGVIAVEEFYIHSDGSQLVVVK